MLAQDRECPALSRHYGRGPYSNRHRPRVSALIEIEYWHGWGAVKPSDG